jgi:hypothetical protein
MKHYRIKEIKSKNESRFWIQKSITLFKIHLFWSNITTAFNLEYAIKEIENLTNEKVTIIHNIK